MRAIGEVRKDTDLSGESRRLRGRGIIRPEGLTRQRRKQSLGGPSVSEGSEMDRVGRGVVR